MAYKFTYITVQHSGTRFLEKYFLHMGFSPLSYTKRCRTCGGIHGYEKHRPEKNSSGRIEYRWRHYTGNPNNNHKLPNLPVGKEKNYPIVSTLRHPHRVAISFLSRKFDLRRCLKMWDNLIELSIHTPIIFYHPDCEEKNRKIQLLDLMHSIDCYEDNTEELTDEFVLDWKPIGAYNSEYKTDYLLDGTLPDVFDWGRFDRAVNWYEKRMEECEY